MGFRDPASDGEAEARSSRFARASAVSAVEAIEDMRDVSGGNAWAGVRDDCGGKAVVRSGADFDLSAAGRVLDGVVEKDGEMRKQVTRTPCSLVLTGLTTVPGMAQEMLANSRGRG